VGDKCTVIYRYGSCHEGADVYPTYFRMLKIYSIHFDGYLLTCRLNSTGAYYKASTKTQNITITQKSNAKQTKQKQNYRKKKNIKEVLGQKPYTLKNINKLI
jgi:hypothetical protein